VLVFLFPLVWVFGLSLKTRIQVFATPPLYLWRPTLENYAAVLLRADFVRAFINTLIISASAVLLSLCVGAPAAYAFARFPFTGRSFLFLALLVMRMLPPIAVLVPMYVLFSKLGLATTRFSVVLADTTFSLPLVVWIMRGYFEDLPVELEESASIDGASRFHTFMRIILPLARPGLMAVSILCLQLAWNDFLFAAVLTNNATQTLPVMMAAFSAGDSGMDWGGLTAAMAMISSVKFPNVALSNPPIAGLGFELRPPVAERLERNPLSFAILSLIQLTPTPYLMVRSPERLAVALAGQELVRHLVLLT
jgi:ABC-type glycerol-3-phosphate transport system permease component